MLVNNIQTYIMPKSCQNKQISVLTRTYNTNPLSSDTFKPSVSFKAAIHDCAEKGDLEGVKRELAKGIDVNSQDNYKNTALIWATRCGLTEVAKELLKHPDIDVNSQNIYKNTALILASYNDNIEFVKELLKHPNIDINIKDAYGKTALDLAKEKRYTVIVKMLEDYVPGVDRREGLMTGVYVKKPPVDITKLSPEENIWTKEEISAYFLNLVKNRNYNVAENMLDVTPLIDLEGNKEILKQVTLTGEPDFARKVFDYERQQSEMQSDYNNIRKEFLENTIKTLSYDQLKNNNIALNTIDGFRVLMNTEKFNPNGVANTITLFERACRIDPDGNLAKEILSKYGDVITVNAARTTNKVIKDLIENYEKVGKYRTVLNSIENNAFYADERRGVAANQLKKLLESPEFTPEIADEVGNSVLHIAAALPDDMGRTLIQLALDKGVDINSGNCTGQRPLMSAIKKLVTTEDNAGKMNLMSNIKFLLDKGADINAQDNNGQTAFHFACMSTVGALLTLLLSKNPNVFLPDKYGNRACVYLKTPEMKEIYKEYVTRSLL